MNMISPNRVVLCVVMVACTSSRKPPAPVAEVTLPLVADASSAAPSETGSATTTTAPRQLASWDDKPPDDAAGKPSAFAPPDPATAYDVGPDTMLLFRRTECFGSCPAYSVGVRGDGSVYFWGAGSTQTVGFASGNIGPAAVSGLLAFLRAKSFLSLHTRYFARATDHPKAIIILRQGRTLKYVEHDESNTSEPALEAIEKEIDRVMGTARWIGQPPSGLAGRYAFPQPGKIPAADFVRMAGPQLRAIERACAPGRGRKVTLTIDVGIDEFGGAVFHGGGYRTETAAAFACVRAQLPTLVFPIASVWEGAPLTVSLGP